MKYVINIATFFVTRTQLLCDLKLTKLRSFEKRDKTIDSSRFPGFELFNFITVELNCQSRRRRDASLILLHTTEMVVPSEQMSNIYEV